jgi:hypothetical protein
MRLFGYAAAGSFGVGTMSRKHLGLAAISILAVGLPASAHHAAVMYERDRTLSVSGTVREFNFINPHSWLYIVVRDANGQTREWAIESSSTASLMRRGWGRDSIKPGDTVSVTFRPMRDGSPGGELETLTMADGRKLE